ncbi:hypothetical protein PF005_g20791 [Phytophthora fragariae]|uniref:RxLR effector protein n=1 Tax=Phytophthora fragariae TaxID=53985 RepID=A0A6A3QC22_9STRA|nr:hypothetical protein PF003_g4629 [Phytophthora fragariae]KAE8927721.1 hypothetical protein PF009_g22117 [Phytophthora fragariae]KAE8977082.1 hypothetical protein PF011_g23794 [Phytophthora fragariae]KAE9072998.1 hypothetical protein PF007_g25972 [Phytophthora fragariae]KAE9113295.1 hypothetical protein PF006_g19785 [Phytophthora fragariae]
MRLSNTTLVVLAAILLASGTAVSKADQTGVPNVEVDLSSHVLAGEDKRFLRSHHTTDAEDKHPEHDEEERKNGENLFAALKIQRMQSDSYYRFLKFGKWKQHRYSPDDVESEVPVKLYNLYKDYRDIYG